MSVPRFDLGPHQMTPSSEGAYVRYEDYAKLEKALEQADTLANALGRLLPCMMTEGEMLDEASLNDGRASDWGQLSVMIRKVLAAYLLEREGKR